MGDIDEIKPLEGGTAGTVMENMEKGISFAQTTSNGWMVIAVRSRVDSFNQDALMEEIQQLVDQGHKRIALDLKGNRFISFPVIKFCVEVAQKLREHGGQLALAACSEKTKRHFEIYGSLSQIKVVRSIAMLPTFNKPLEDSF